MKQMKPIFASLIAFLIFASCDNDDSLKTAPEIPPVETMVIDFGKLGDETTKSGEVVTNWLFSVATVGIWNVIIGTTFALPVAAFQKAANQQAVLIQDLTWQWAYNFEFFADQYQARLIGKLESAKKIKWEMYISKTGTDPLEEFLWFEGTSNTNGRDGQWILYTNVKPPVKTVQIDWDRENDKVGKIVYTYVREKNEQHLPDPLLDSKLTYGLQEGEMDVYVDVNAYDSGSKKMAETNIQWDHTHYNGRVKAEHFFNDNHWHCWDDQGKDMVCETE